MSMKGKVVALVERCVDCNEPMAKNSRHHFRCNNCWSFGKPYTQAQLSLIARIKKARKKARKEVKNG